MGNTDTAPDEIPGRSRGGIFILRGSFWRSPQGRQVDMNTWRLTGRRRRVLMASIELLCLLVWTLIIARPYLNLDPTLMPNGREYGSAIQTHHFWVQLRECGACALWNGSVRGGNPALVDPYGSLLHPLVAVTTLGWGVLNGSKLALAGALLMAGLAQWWLAHELGVGWVARMWTAAMAVAAGNLAGRMEIGVFGVVLSTAASSLVFPALLRVNRIATRRSAVILGVMLALVLMAGQGYMQIGLAFVLLAGVLLLPSDRTRSLLIIRRYGLAAGLALCLGAVFLAPFLHFLPQFVKDMDPKFASAQPFAYVPLNLVISDYRFYMNDALSKSPYPYLYINYVGWLAVILAFFGLRGTRNDWQRRVVPFLACAAFLAFWVASAEPLRALVRDLPFQWLIEQVAGIRHPSLISGLAVLPVLGLAGLGLDWLLAIAWPKFKLVLGTSEQASGTVSLDLRWVLVAPLLLALMSAQSFGTRWMGMSRLDPAVFQILDALHTPDLQWVNAPFGEHYFQAAAVSKGLKLASGIRTWNWRGSSSPEPVLEADRQGAPVGMTRLRTVADVPIHQAGPGREYATVSHDDGGRTICKATGTGGNIDVVCETPQAGVLTVRENQWSGWKAELAGSRAQLLSGQWLAVNLPKGSHVLRFRYRPWDVVVGVVLSAIGVILALYLGLRPERRITTES